MFKSSQSLNSTASAKNANSSNEKRARDEDVSAEEMRKLRRIKDRESRQKKKEERINLILNHNAVMEKNNELVKGNNKLAKENAELKNDNVMLIMENLQQKERIKKLEADLNSAIKGLYTLNPLGDEDSSRTIHQTNTGIQSKYWSENPLAEELAVFSEQTIKKSMFVTPSKEDDIKRSTTKNKFSSNHATAIASKLSIKNDDSSNYSTRKVACEVASDNDLKWWELQDKQQDFVSPQASNAVIFRQPTPIYLDDTEELIEALHKAKASY
jgi:hypothetical protein